MRPRLKETRKQQVKVIRAGQTINVEGKHANQSKQTDLLVRLLITLKLQSVCLFCGDVS